MTRESSTAKMRCASANRIPAWWPGLLLIFSLLFDFGGRLVGGFLHLFLGLPGGLGGGLSGILGGLSGILAGRLGVAPRLLHILSRGLCEKGGGSGGEQGQS